MITVRQLLKKKSGPIWSIAPNASVFDAIKLMADKKIGALLVLDENQLVGIVSERDYATKVMLQGRSSKETPVRAIMTGKVRCATSGIFQSLRYAAQSHVRTNKRIELTRANSVLAENTRPASTGRLL